MFIQSILLKYLNSEKVNMDLVYDLIKCVLLKNPNNLMYIPLDIELNDELKNIVVKSIYNKDTDYNNDENLISEFIRNYRRKIYVDLKNNNSKINGLQIKFGLFNCNINKILGKSKLHRISMQLKKEKSYHINK